ncbi:MAG: universal stress protein [Acidobacteria bacterium]|nr:universal stress protein [Acidobacteriota bacterium]MBI3656665.1 universal stress protein [Acidobacteriota bacterium]
MLNIKRVLCPTDFSEYSEKALKYAADLSIRFKATLFIQHVMEDVLTMVPDVYGSLTDFQSMREAYERDVIERLQLSIGPEISATTILGKGSTAAEILKTAKEKDVDLIVMGSHGRKGLGRLVIGSVAEQIVKKAQCPVLTVCHLEHAPPRPLEFQRVLTAVDYSDHSLRALEFALSFVEDYQSELYLLHVIDHLAKPELAGFAYDPAHYEEREMEASRRRLRNMVPDELWSKYSIKPIAKIGHPYREITHTALSIAADLVIMGVVGHRAIGSTLFGSTTYRVIKEVHCPVLTIRGRKGET